MALMMTLMPIGNVLPEVSVYAAGATVTITADEYITGLSLQPSSGDAIVGIPGEYYKFAFSSVSAGTYAIQPTFREGISDTKFGVSETSIMVGDIDISETIYTVVKSDTSFSVTTGDSTIKNVDGATKDGSNYKISADTNANTEVKIKVELDKSKQIDTVTPSAMPVYSFESGKRYATITIKASDIVKMVSDEVPTPAVVITTKDVDSYSVVATNTTVTIPDDAFCKKDGTNFYKPLSDAENFSLTITPVTNYELTTFTVGGTDYLSTATGGTFVINSTNAGRVVAESSNLPTPNGTFSTFNPYYGKSDSVAVTYTIPTSNIPTGCTVQMAVKNNNDALEEADWNNAYGTVEGTNMIFTKTVGYDTNIGIKKVYVRYKKNSIVSESVSSNEIKFDYTAPSDDSAVLLINGDAQGTLDYTVNKKQDDENQVKIRITARDNESGLKELHYSFDNINWNTESFLGNTCDILYKFENKSDKIYYYISDNVGNETNGSQYIDISNIKFDLLAPTFDVDYYVLDGTPTGTAIQESELANWQTKSIKVIVTPNEATAPAGETESGLATNPVAVTYEDGTPISVTSNGGKYEFTLSDSKENKFKIAVSDNAGNIFVSDIKTVKIDTVGLSGIKLTVGGWDTPTAFYGNVEVKVSVDQSVSGLKKVDFIFHDNASGYEAIKTIDAASNVATCAFPIEEFSNGFDGYVKAVCYDDTGVSIFPHVQNKDISPIQYSKNAAIITLNANQEWTNQNVPVSFVVENQKTSIAKIIYYVDGVEKETITAFEDPHKYSFTFDVDKVSSSPAGTEVVVKVINNAGLETRNNIYVFIDKQSPTVTLGGVTEGTTYNSARSLQITTNDNIWQKLQPVSVTATKTIDGNTTNIDLGSYTVDSANHVMSKAFSEDGIYNVTVKAVDAAGNTDTKTISFTIDRTAPVISMSGVKEGAYSSNPVTVTFQSVESFFDTNNVKITVERKIEGSTYERTLTFNNTGKTSNLANTFTEDGDYTITMTAVDRAGNEATPQTLSFTVDCTAPSVTLTGTKDYFVTNQPVTLDFLVKEAYFETNQVQIRGSRRLANGKTEAINISGWSNTGISSSLSNEFMEDGYYTITISATDKAGNNKQQTIHFTIDTEAPVIGDLSQYDGKYLSSFELKESLEDLISELSVPTVKMTLNGEAYDGHEITEDGKYTLVIEVVDEVGLSSTKSVEFVIDKTAPKIIFAGVEDKKTYTEAVRLNLSLENENDTIVEILINGEPYELTEGQSSYDISFDTFGDYEVVVLTIDEAGNDNSQTIQFTYAEHKNMAFLWIVIGAVVVAAGLVIFLVVKSKKKQ